MPRRTIHIQTVGLDLLRFAEPLGEAVRRANAQRQVSLEVNSNARLWRPEPAGVLVANGAVTQAQQLALPNTAVALTTAIPWLIAVERLTAALVELVDAIELRQLTEF